MTITTWGTGISGFAGANAIEIQNHRVHGGMRTEGHRDIWLCMKFLLAGVFLGITAACSPSKEKKVTGCEDFWTGTFYNEQNNVINTKITRTKEYQVEEYIPTGAVCKLRVEWIDSCSYRLSYVSGNNACPGKSFKDVIVRIVEVKENSCLVEATAVDGFLKYKSELFKGR